MTEQEFINQESAVWGEQYIFDLIERGYSVRLTDHGWVWCLPQRVDSVTTVYANTTLMALASLA
jgi:hypothetical protein